MNSLAFILIRIPDEDAVVCGSGSAMGAATSASVGLVSGFWLFFVPELQESKSRDIPNML